MSPPQRQRMAQISGELAIHVVTLYNSRKSWRLQGKAVPASQKEPEGWGPAGKFTVALETAGLNATERGAIAVSGSCFLNRCSAGTSRPGCQSPAASADGQSERPAKAAPGEAEGDQKGATGTATSATAAGHRSDQVVLLRNLLIARNRAWNPPLPLPGDRRL